MSRLIQFSAPHCSIDTRACAAQPRQVNLLAAQAQYSVVVNAALFNELLGSYPDQTDV